MDASKRSRLIEQIKSHLPSDRQQSRPLVALEAFFDGNDDHGSIGCNLPEHPGPQAFFTTLSRIRSHPDVQDVLVEIAEVVEEDTTMWPFAERIYILTNAIEEQVKDWMAELEPDAITADFAFGTPPLAPPLQTGIQVYNVWWD